MDPIKDIPIGTGATLWTYPATGANYILELHQALMFTDTLEHSLLNPNDRMDTVFAMTLGISTDLLVSPIAISRYLYPFGPKARSSPLIVVHPLQMSCTRCPTLYLLTTFSGTL